MQGNFFEIPVKGRHSCPSLRSREQGFDGAPGKQPEFWNLLVLKPYSRMIMQPPAPLPLSLPWCLQFHHRAWKNEPLLNARRVMLTMSTCRNRIWKPEPSLHVLRGDRAQGGLRVCTRERGSGCMGGHRAPLLGGWVLPALHYEGLDRKQEAPGFQQDWGLTARRGRSPAGRGGCGKQSARALPETIPPPALARRSCQESWFWRRPGCVEWGRCVGEP